MRDFRDAKAMAQTLREALKSKSVSLTHSESLELVAKTLGFHDWNVPERQDSVRAPAACHQPHDSDPMEPPATCPRRRRLAHFAAAGYRALPADDRTALCGPQ